jgi:hypothetical protein
MIALPICLVAFAIYVVVRRIENRLDAIAGSLASIEAGVSSQVRQPPQQPGGR